MSPQLSATAVAFSGFDISGNQGSAEAYNLPDSAVNRPRLRPWRVVHASNGHGGLGALVEAQTFCGMYPTVVRPQGAEFPNQPEGDTHRISLLQTWKSVRNWRRALLQDENASHCEILHAHCFAAAMAGVRYFPSVVYDLDFFFEDVAGQPGQRSRDSRWRSRSLRMAEQFVMSRAAAIVVRRESLRQAILQRGVQAEHVFVIPAPLSEETDSAGPGPVLAATSTGLRSAGRIYGGTAFTVFAAVEAGTDWRRWLRNLLQAARSAHAEVPQLGLCLQADDELCGEVRDALARSQLDFEAEVVTGSEADHTLSACSLVIAGEVRQPSSTPLENPLVSAAFRHRKPLLAIDVSCNRDVTPNGSGCLWFWRDDVADLTRRIVFLASNEAFRSSLAASGERYFRSSRDPLLAAGRPGKPARQGCSRCSAARNPAATVG